MTVAVLAAVVFAGAFAQAATGIGFGVVAGPLLLQAQGYHGGMAATAALSLLIAVATALASPGAVDRRRAALLCACLAPGLALGAGLAWALPQFAILGTFGILLVALGLSLLPARPAAAGRGSIGGPPPALALAGILAGAGAYLFAAPGPAAAWGLARARLEPAAVRGTLAIYFIAAYGAILVAFACSGRLAAVDCRAVLAVAPAALAGIAAGQRLGSRLPPTIMQRVVGSLVLASGTLLLSTVMQG